METILIALSHYNPKILPTEKSSFFFPHDLISVFSKYSTPDSVFINNFQSFVPSLLESKHLNRHCILQ